MEQRLLDALRILGNQEEIAEYGEIYLEAKKSSFLNSEGSVFPSVLTNIKEDISFAQEDYLKYVGSVLTELGDFPGSSIVDLATFTPPSPGGGDEYDTQANPMIKTDTSTVFTGPGPKSKEEWAATAAVPYRCKISLDRFRCEKSSGDGAFNGRDEIYWAIASGADTQDKVEHRTGESGSVETNDLRFFDKVNFFSGSVNSVLAGHISCWEADDSTGGWYNALQEFLGQVWRQCAKDAMAVTPDFTWIVDIESQAYDMALKGLVISIAAFFSWLMAAIRNDDDFVARHDMAFTRGGLRSLFFKSDNEMDVLFDGGGQGKHRLWLKGVVAGNPTGAQKLSIFNGSGWSTLNAPTGNSVHGTTLVDYQGTLTSIIRDHTDKTYWRKYNKSSGAWSTARVTSSYSNVIGKPGIATYNDRIYAAYRIADEYVMVKYATNNLDDWTTVPTPSSVRTPSGPAIAAHNGSLYLVFRGRADTIYWTCMTGSSVSGPHKFASGTTSSAPAICVYNNVLYCAVRGLDNALWYNKFDGSNWTSIKKIESGCIAGPSLAVYNGKMYCTHRGQNSSAVWIMSFDGSAWSSATQLSGSLCIGKQSLCAYDGKLWCSWGILAD